MIETKNTERGFGKSNFVGGFISNLVATESYQKTYKPSERLYRVWIRTQKSI